jgi:hypothetical protein
MSRSYHPSVSTLDDFPLLHALGVRIPEPPPKPRYDPRAPIISMLGGCLPARTAANWDDYAVDWQAANDYLNRQMFETLSRRLQPFLAQAADLWREARAAPPEYLDPTHRLAIRTDFPWLIDGLGSLD